MMHCDSAEKLARLGTQSEVHIFVKFAGTFPFHLHKRGYDYFVMIEDKTIYTLNDNLQRGNAQTMPRPRQN
jgi:hypothetical protein